MADGSGSKRAKSMRIHAHPGPNIFNPFPQYIKLQYGEGAKADLHGGADERVDGWAGAGNVEHSRPSRERYRAGGGTPGPTGGGGGGAHTTPEEGGELCCREGGGEVLSTG
jgi:hypothetical protein